MSANLLAADAEHLPSSRALGIAGVLRKRLYTGVYAPGQWLREGVLRDEFGVSNGPIREALQLLVADGLLERMPQRGIRVIDLSREEIIELVQLRVVLLELGAELAALRRDPAQLARMPEVLKRIKAGGGELPQIAGHLVGWIFSAAGNERLTQTWERTQGPVRLYIQRAATSAKSAWPDLDEQARVLLDRIAAGDAAGARQQARDLTRNMAAKLDLEVGLPPTDLNKTNAKEKSRG